MTTLVEFNSHEKKILIDVLNEYSNKGIHLLDSLNISNIIENMIYEKIEEYYENGSLKCKYTLRFIWEPTAHWRERRIVSTVVGPRSGYCV